MMRLPDWPELLADFIEARRFTPFGWGTNDCCLFAADAVQAMTGIDLAQQYRGTYATAISAASVLETGGGIEAIAASKLPDIELALVQRGDIVVIDGGNGATLAVCLGAQVAAPGAEELAFFPVSNAVRAWRV